MKTLSKNQVTALHSALIREFGGIDGIRDEGLLESALAAPFQTFGGEPVYPSLQAKAAQLGFGLIRNHPFVDGNKRIGAHTMLVFLAVNGIELRYEQQELIDIVLSVAAGQIDRQGLLQWILDHEITNRFCGFPQGLFAFWMCYSPNSSLTIRSLIRTAPTRTSRLKISSPT